MTIRRWIALALVVALSLTLTPPASRAQIPMIMNGVVNATNASVNAANTTTETLLYQFLVPSAMIASWTSTNAYAAAPLHLRLNGTIRTNPPFGGAGGSVGGATLGVNLGGASATLVVVNGTVFEGGLGGAGSAAGACPSGQSGQCTQTPVGIDVWFSPIATVTTQNCTDLRPCPYSLYMYGRFAFATSAGTNYGTETVMNAATLGTVNVNLAAGQTLNVLWRWASAASNNSLNIYNGTLLLGN